MHQRDCRGVAGAMEHALAEEGAAEAYPVKPAAQRIFVMDLDGVAMADIVELAIKRADAPIDPGPRTARSRLGAAFDASLEIAVANDGERLCPNGAGKSRRNMKAIERNDAAQLRFDPIERRIVGVLSHRKNPARIGLEQHFGRDLDMGRVAACHGSREIAMFAARRQEFLTPHCLGQGKMRAGNLKPLVPVIVRDQRTGGRFPPEPCRSRPEFLSASWVWREPQACRIAVDAEPVSASQQGEPRFLPEL